MRQRILFRTLLGAQFLIFLFLLGSGAYLFWLSHSKEVLAEPDAREAIQGLRLSAAFCAGTCLLWGASFLGIVRRQPWGWWLGLVVNFFVTVITAWSLVFDEPHPEAEDYLVPAVFLLVVIIQLLARPTSWKGMDEAATIVNEVQQSAGSGI